MTKENEKRDEFLIGQGLVTAPAIRVLRTLAIRVGQAIEIHGILDSLPDIDFRRKHDVHWRELLCGGCIVVDSSIILPKSWNIGDATDHGL